MRATLITCTGDRQEAFSLCERFIARQSHKYDRWIVVDDGLASTRCSQGQEVLRLPSVVGPSLNRNLRAALDLCSAIDEAVLIIEDDDWYAADYIETTLKLLPSAALVGHGGGVYYHVGLRRFRNNRVSAHARLCATALRFEIVPCLQRIARGTDPYIDLRLWGKDGFKGAKRLTFDRPCKCIGIKGMPGRRGIGIGHRETWMRRRGHSDPSLTKLRELIGSDADLYAKFYMPGKCDPS
jgi:hypothetical protein